MLLSMEVHRHKLAYLSLVIGLLGLVLAYFLAWPNLWGQRLVILLMVLFYLFWGLTAHVKTEYLSRRIVYEYLGVALLGGVLLWLMTL